MQYVTPGILLGCRCFLYVLMLVDHAAVADLAIEMAALLPAALAGGVIHPGQTKTQIVAFHLLKASGHYALPGAANQHLHRLDIIEHLLFAVKLHSSTPL